MQLSQILTTPFSYAQRGISAAGCGISTVFSGALDVTSRVAKLAVSLFSKVANPALKLIRLNPKLSVAVVIVAIGTVVYKYGLKHFKKSHEQPTNGAPAADSSSATDGAHSGTN